jgi:CRISPR-associated protein Cas4
MIDVSELEAFAFCKKKWYHRSVLGIEIKYDLLELGELLHEWHDRPISKSEMYLSNEDLALKGKIDFIISENSNPHIPVEIKKSIGNNGIYHSHEIQICAYALLLIKNFEHMVPYGYLIYKEQKKKIKIQFTADLMNETLSMIKEIKYLKDSFENNTTNTQKTQGIIESMKNIKKTQACLKCALEDFCWI